MTLPNLLNSKDPWWVRSITMFGVPAAIAMYLVWALVSGQTAALQAINTTIQAHHSAALPAIAQVLESANEAKMDRLRLEQYLRLLCVNTAKNTSDRTTCLSVR